MAKAPSTALAKTAEKSGPGRPSKYDPSYCELVIADARLGFSLSAFAGGIPVSRDTVTGWREQYPEFDEACEKAKVVRARFLEGGMMEKDIPAPAMNARRFALVNCAPHDWREKLALTGGDPGDEPLRMDVTTREAKVAAILDAASRRARGE